MNRNLRTPEGRARKAIEMIVAKQTDDRSFDDFFEQGDGDYVVTQIIHIIMQNQAQRTAVAKWHGGELIDGMPAAWVQTYTRINQPSLLDHQPMSQLTHTPEHGHVWHTDCAKCGTRQKIRIGDCSLAEAAAAVEKLDNSPMECPGGYHTELGGWRKRWHLDEMIAALSLKQQSQIEDMARTEATPIIEVQAEVIPPETPGAESAASADRTVVHLLTKHEFASLPPDHEWVREVAAYADKVTVGNTFSYGRDKTPEGRGELHRVYLRYKFNSDSSPVPLAVLQSHLLDDEEPCYTSSDWFSREVYAHLAEVNAPAQASPPPPETPGAPSAPSADSTPPAVPLLTVGTDNSRVVAAKNIRLELAHHFPGIKFSVKGSTFSMGDAIDVHWTMGPTTNEVDAIIDRYQECDFDGSDDSTHYRTGEARKFTDAHGGARFASTSRNTEGAWYIIGHALCLEHGIEDPEPFDKRDYHRINIGLPDSAGTLANLMLGDTSFPPGVTVTGITLNPNSTHYRTKYMPRFDALNPTGTTKPPEFPRHLAIKLLCQPWECQTGPYGDYNSELRRDILQALTGTRPPKAKSGCTAVRNAIATHYGVSTAEAGCTIDDGIRAGLRRTILADYEDNSPEFKAEIAALCEKGGKPLDEVYALWCVHLARNPRTPTIEAFRKMCSYDLGLDSDERTRRTTLADAIATSNAKNAIPEDMPTIPPAKPKAKPTPHGDIIRKIPAGTFAFLSGQPDGTAIRTAFAAWVDTGSHAGDWRKLFAEYQKETASLPAPAADETPDIPEGACILTEENMHTADDCTLHDHEPAEPEPEAPTNILPFSPSTAAAPTAAQLAMERLRRAAQR